MLFRVVRPLKRKSSRSTYVVQRIPADIKSRIAGQRLAIPFGNSVKFVTPTARAQSITFSLGTDDPAQVKILQAAIAGHLEGVWQALHNDAPIKLSHRQATALAGDLYRIWADSEHRARTISVEHVAGVGWERNSETQEEQEAHWTAVVAMWQRVGTSGDAADLEEPLGLLVDRLLLTKGIYRVEDDSRATQKARALSVLIQSEPIRL